MKNTQAHLVFTSLRNLHGNQSSPRNDLTQPKRAGRGTIGIGDFRRNAPSDGRLRYVRGSRRADWRVETQRHGAQTEDVALERARVSRRSRSRDGGPAEALAEQRHVSRHVGNRRGGAHREWGRVATDRSARTRGGVGGDMR